MAADALAPCVTRLSAAMALSIQNKQAIVFNEVFNLPALS